MSTGEVQYALKILGHRKLLPLPQGVHVIGSDPKYCDVVISHESVRSIHAEILVGPRQLRIRDLSRMQKTFMNGRSVEFLHEIGVQDLIQLGQVECRIIRLCSETSLEGEMDVLKGSDTQSIKEESTGFRVKKTPAESRRNEKVGCRSKPKSAQRHDPRHTFPMVSTPADIRITAETSHPKSNRGFVVRKLIEQLRRVHWTILVGLSLGIAVFWWSFIGGNDREVHGKLTRVLSDLREMQRGAPVNDQQRSYLQLHQLEVRRIAEKLQPNANRRSRAKLELLRASRDCLLKALANFPSGSETLLNRAAFHLDRAERLMNGESFSELKFDPGFHSGFRVAL